jgi:hypothetical protein
MARFMEMLTPKYSMSPDALSRQRLEALSSRIAAGFRVQETARANVTYRTLARFISYSLGSRCGRDRCRDRRDYSATSA